MIAAFVVSSSGDCEWRDGRSTAIVERQSESCERARSVIWRIRIEFDANILRERIVLFVVRNCGRREKTVEDARKTVEAHVNILSWV